MKQNRNIVEILKDKPQGTKLYDLLRNIEVELDSISHTDYENIIWCRYNDVDPYDLYGYSTFGTERGWLNGLQILLPSKEMRDWNKFAWKKGNVLKNTAYEERVIFDGFLNDDYTYFKGKHPLDCSNKFNITYHEECNCFTGNYRLESTDAAQTYINTIEERLGGKLNLETLEIEKAQSEFKDGDIVTQGVLKGVNVYIIKNCMDKIDNKYNYYARYNTQDKEINYDDWSHISPFAKFATDSEKQQLFSALAKEGKAWNAEKKQIVDLKPKVKFKPFDKIVGFEELGRGEWVCDMFSHYAEDDGRDVIIGIGGLAYLKALPFNEETAKLIGTTDDWEG